MTLTSLKSTRPKPIAPDRTAIHAEANNGEMCHCEVSQIQIYRVQYSVEQLPREFSTKLPQYSTTQFCMQTFSEFLCQHKIELDRGYFIVISGTPDHQSETIMETRFRVNVQTKNPETRRIRCETTGNESNFAGIVLRPRVNFNPLPLPKI